MLTSLLDPPAGRSSFVLRPQVDSSFVVRAYSGRIARFREGRQKSIQFGETFSAVAGAKGLETPIFAMGRTLRKPIGKRSASLECLFNPKLQRQVILFLSVEVSCLIGGSAFSAP